MFSFCFFSKCLCHHHHLSLSPQCHNRTVVLISVVTISVTMAVDIIVLLVLLHVLSSAENFRKTRDITGSLFQCQGRSSRHQPHRDRVFFLDGHCYCRCPSCIVIISTMVSLYAHHPSHHYVHVDRSDLPPFL